MCGLSVEELEKLKAELQPEPLLDKGGHKVSKSPWGPADEIGRLNWITPESVATIMARMDGRKLFDLNVVYESSMPSWTEAGDPPFSIWMTHTPKGEIAYGRSGYSGEIHKEYSYSGDANIHVHPLRHPHRYVEPHGILGNALERLDTG